VKHAHTDGDSLIWFTGANVVHMGDNFFNATYPYIDVDSGGNVDGMIASAQHVLARIDSDTKIIPGHGVLGGAEDLRRFRDVLILARDRVGTMINDGMSLDEIIAALPMSDHDETWGGGFMSPDRFLTVVYRGLADE
jgi:cyclase